MTDPRRRAVAARLRAVGCVFAEEEADLLLATAPAGELEQWVGRRLEGHPLEHVVGWAQFCGLRIAVTAGVFVPRRRTELLVGTALDVAPSTAVVVDLCCGSGAVGAAILAARPDVELYAADVDPAAVLCARQNLPAGQVLQSDLYDALPRGLLGRIDVLVANTPYVPTGAIGLLPPEARLHEPLVALDGGPDGLDVQRRLLAEAARWLAPGGHLLVETSQGQVAQVAEQFVRSGLEPRVVRCADSGATVVVGARNSRSA